MLTSLKITNIKSGKERMDSGIPMKRLKTYKKEK